MNPRITQIEGKLGHWRFSGTSDEEIVDEIYKLVFNDDFYREIWDEFTLRGLRDLIVINPPNIAVFGTRLKEIEQRTSMVVAINDLFHALLAGSSERFSEALLHLFPGSTVEHLNSARLGLGMVEDGSVESPATRINDVVAKLSSQFPELPFATCFAAFQDRQEVGMVNGLLVRKPSAIGIVLPVRTRVEAGIGKVEAAIPTEESFTSAVRRAQGALQTEGLLGKTQDVTFTVHDTDATYIGSSIALPSAMAIFSSARGWQFDPYTAFTGNIDLRGSQWRIVRVEGIPEKLAAAQSAGIRRVILPAENKDSVPHELNGLDLVFVDDMKQVLSALTLPRTQHVETLQQHKILLINGFCAERGWQLSAAREIQKGLQFTVTPPTGAGLTINVYDSGSHTPKEHQRSEFQELLQQLNELDKPDIPLQSINKTVVVITDEEVRKQIQGRLEGLGPAERKLDQYCDYSYVYESGKEKLFVRQYSSGKLHLQGFAGPLYKKALEIILTTYKLHYPNASLNIADYLSELTPTAASHESNNEAPATIEWPVIGTDESGKGDYFGPLVIAGVWVDAELEKSLAAIGVRDSKKLSDRQCIELAVKIRECCPGKYDVVEISPDRYNSLYDEFVLEKKTLNHLLAWGHARAIEDLLNGQRCKNAIADQFGDEKYITSKLMEKGKSINLVQTTKAERYIAVAAASILARDRFLSRLKQLSSEVRVLLPKGASPAVVQAGKQIVEKHGVEALRKFAKLHFKTTRSVLAE